MKIINATDVNDTLNDGAFPYCQVVIIYTHTAQLSVPAQAVCVKESAGGVRVEKNCLCIKKKVLKLHS